MEPLNLNLDCVTDDPAELREIAAVLRNLATYAESRALSIELRKDGYIAVAQGCESACENIYQRLPDWAKW